MPYAANGKIAEDRFTGAIKITDEQYKEALEGMCAGLVVTIDGGFNVGPPAPVEPPPAPEPTPEELVMLALVERDRLLARAALRMAPLQYAIDLGAATPDEIESLNRWKRYCVELNRIEQQATFPQAIEWPKSPDISITH